MKIRASTETQRIILVRPYKAYVQSPCKILQEPSLVPNSVHQTIFDQELASPTLSSTARKIVTQWFWSGVGASTQSVQHKELMQVFDQVLSSPT